MPRISRQLSSTQQFVQVVSTPRQLFDSERFFLDKTSTPLTGSLFGFLSTGGRILASTENGKICRWSPPMLRMYTKCVAIRDYRGQWRLVTSNCEGNIHLWATNEETPCRLNPTPWVGFSVQHEREMILKRWPCKKGDWLIAGRRKDTCIRLFTWADNKFSKIKLTMTSKIWDVLPVDKRLLFRTASGIECWKRSDTTLNPVWTKQFDQCSLFGQLYLVEGRQGPMVLSCPRQGYLSVWNVKDGSVVVEQHVGCASSISTAGRIVCWANAKGTVLWNPSTADYLELSGVRNPILLPALKGHGLLGLRDTKGEQRDIIALRIQDKRVTVLGKTGSSNCFKLVPMMPDSVFFRDHSWAFNTDPKICLISCNPFLYRLTNR